MKATFNGTTLAESDKTVMVEGNHYFPPDSVKTEYFTNRKEASYTCPWKGEADYYDVEVPGGKAEGAAWTYPNPKEGAREIAGHFAFEKDVTVEE